MGGAALLVTASVDVRAAPLRLALVALVGASLATLSPLSLGLVAARSPAALARANAVYNGCYALGLMLGPALVAAALAAGPARWVVLASGGAWCGHGLLAALGRARSMRVRASAHEAWDGSLRRGVDGG